MGEIHSLVRIHIGHLRSIFLAIEQPIVNIDGNINRVLEDMVASSVSQNCFADSIELIVDSVRFAITYVVQKCSCKWDPCVGFEGNVITASKLVGLCSGICELVVEGDPREDFEPVLSRVDCVRSNTKVDLRIQQRCRCRRDLIRLGCIDYTD